MKVVFEIESEAVVSGSDTRSRGLARRAQERDGARAHFDLLQKRLLQHRLMRLEEAREMESIRRAATEAASLSWLTDFPLLVFPILFDELSAAALARAEHQTRVYARSRHILECGASSHSR